MPKAQITFKGVDLDIHYFYQPYEPPERGPEAQYPGCSERYEIEEIYIAGMDAFELLEDQLDEIEKKLID